MKYLYISIGVIALGLGGMGIILPLLPTTPFLIVAAVCFSKSSEKMDRWLKKTKIYINYVEPVLKNQGMTVDKKVRVGCTLTLLLGSIAFFMRENSVGIIILMIVWVGHVIGIGLGIKTK